MLHIAIDGPASSGKSTLAKALSEALDIIYLDTGAMYRAVTLALQEQAIDLSDIEAVQDVLARIDIDFAASPSGQRVYLNGHDVTEAIRQDDVTNAVSEVAAIKEVRAALVAMQQRLALNQSIVMDGRDIGTVVLPEADYKFYLTASPEIRAERRFAENQAKGLSNQSYEALLESIIQRDAYDSSRAESPLRKASDAIELDNSHMTTEATVAHILNIIRQ